MTVLLSSSYIAIRESSFLYAVAFGLKQCQCELTPMTLRTGNVEYLASVEIPPPDLTGFPPSAVPLSFIVRSHDCIHAMDIGLFSYGPMISIPRLENTSTLSSTWSSDVSPTYTEPLQLHQPSEIDLQCELNMGLLARPFTSSFAVDGQQGFGTHLDTSETDARYLLCHGQAPSNEGNPNMATHVMDPGDTSILAGLCIGCSGLPTTDTLGSPHQAACLSPRKMAIKIDGDLNSLTKDWSAEELKANRRLVDFHCSIGASMISIKFSIHDTEKGGKRSCGCLSCIYWPKRRQCVFTGTDILTLLEAIFCIQFTAAEKNRIRRNLEIFDPLTIHGGDTDTRELFNIIMGFGSSQPRHIRRSIKVLSWDKLAGALRKGVGKVVPSQSHTDSLGCLFLQESYQPPRRQLVDDNRNTGAFDTRASSAIAQGASGNTAGKQDFIDDTAESWPPWQLLGA
ncbi:hypothetical protein EYZ11_005400 [Aspergillus tanneri]|uniref:DUF7082 domain-containing protein n=1 Tax=Aspergillus tanneri TaxID=1220188 RepID=A0A4S3JI03_9EURO|nr:hypothetical protein EYZ11_005400 [Aspergillus tanneri]